MFEAVVNDIKNNINKLDFLKKYYNAFPINNKFYYELYSLTSDVLTIDVNSFNANFLKLINHHINSTALSGLIDNMLNSDKQKRVVTYGLFFRDIKNAGIDLHPYMIGFRNLVLSNFLEMYGYSRRSISLYRINYDDIEFSTLNNESFTEHQFVNEKCISIIKFKKIDHVVTLNKSDGIYYVKDGKIIDIKYTSGWVDIPIYKILLNEIIGFIVDKSNSYTISDLNDKMRDIIENSHNDLFFGYKDDKLSSKYNPTDNVPMSIKNLFISRTISKFVLLLNRL
jgi:hypothetical protein